MFVISVSDCNQLRMCFVSAYLKRAGNVLRAEIGGIHFSPMVISGCSYLIIVKQSI